MKLNGTGPVIGIDIDGTLGDYHSWFISFAEMYTGRKLPDPADINPGENFSRFLGLSKSLYRQIKLAYRQGGLKRGMPCYPGAGLLCSSLRGKGAEIWICTSRPFNQLGNVDPDTRHWLRRNGIQYDNVLWGERKYIDLHKRAGDRVVAILDDLPEMVLQANMLGIPAVLRSQPYNRHIDPEWRVESLDGAAYVLEQLLEEWKEAHDATPTPARSPVRTAKAETHQV